MEGSEEGQARVTNNYFHLNVEPSRMFSFSEFDTQDSCWILIISTLSDWCDENKLFSYKLACSGYVFLH